jgi:Mg2+ and Co2+ transporter CorA
MHKKIYEISRDGVLPYSSGKLNSNQLNESSVYLYEIKSDDRTDAIDELRPLITNEDILKYLENPSEHIRFEIIENIAYGELAFFSSKSEDPVKYIAIMNFRNILIIVHEKEIDISMNVLDSFTSIMEKNITKLETKHLLYVLIVEVITQHGKLILDYRQEIEAIAKDFDKNFNELSPDEFLKAKSHISDFIQVIEKIHFSLFFPPVKNILDKESPYRKYFEELLKSVDMLKISLVQAENRLNSLHDHYLLLLQEKSNKRINFLTIIQAIFVPLTLVVGIYGMNFIYMPELNYKYSYFIVLGGMLIISTIFLRYFYKHGWFS